MKIVQIVSTFLPYYGGMGNAAYHFSRGLAQRGHEVTVLTTKGRPGEFVKFKVKKLKPIFAYGNAAIVPQVFSALGGFEVVHLHLPYFGVVEAVWLWRKFNPRTKFVITYHMDTVGQGIRKVIFKIHNKIFLSSIIRSADKITFSSFDYLKNSLLASAYQKNPQKFAEIMFGADERFFPTTKDQSLLQKHGLNAQNKIILFVGNLDQAHYFKGVEYLIQAFGQIKEQAARLMIVGGGNLKSFYEKKARELGVAERVVFSGQVNDDDLAKYYNLADVVTLPAIDKTEAFGLVLVEAMACAKPVVASDLAGVRTLIDDGLNGYLTQPKNSDDLALKISQIINSPRLITEFGQASRKKVVAQYNWLQVAQKLEEVYNLI